MEFECIVGTMVDKDSQTFDDVKSSEVPIQNLLLDQIWPILLNDDTY